jgi:hypothetical protein
VPSDPWREWLSNVGQKTNTPPTHTTHHTHKHPNASALGTASKSSRRAHTFKYTHTMRQHTREAQPHSAHTKPPLAPTQGVACIRVIVQCNPNTRAPHTRHKPCVISKAHTLTRLKPTHAPLRTKGAAVVEPAHAAHPDQVPQTKARNAGREGDRDLRRNPGVKTAGIAGSGVCDSMQAGGRGAYRAQHTCEQPPRPCLQPVRSVLGAAHAPSTRTAQVQPADPPGPFPACGTRRTVRTQTEAPLQHTLSTIQHTRSAVHRQKACELPSAGKGKPAGTHVATLFPAATGQPAHAATQHQQRSETQEAPTL